MNGLRELFQRAAAKTGEEIYSKVCKVTDVDSGARTIDVEPVDGGAPILGVRLQASEGLDDGIYIEPAKDSFCIVTFLGDDKAFASAFDTIEKIELGGSSNGRVVNISDLATQVDKIVLRMDALAAGIAAIPGVTAADVKAALLAAWPDTSWATTGGKPDISDSAIGNEKVEH